MSWNTLWGYVSEILRDPSSHLSSALNGDRYVPHSAERAVWAVFEQWLNTQMPKGSGRKKVPRPWAGKKPDYRPKPKDPSSDPASAARREKLAALF